MTCGLSKVLLLDQQITHRNRTVSLKSSLSAEPFHRPIQNDDTLAASRLRSLEGALTTPTQTPHTNPPPSSHHSTWVGKKPQAPPYPIPPYPTTIKLNQPQTST